MDRSSSISLDATRADMLIDEERSKSDATFLRVGGVEGNKIERYLLMRDYLNR